MKALLCESCNRAWRSLWFAWRFLRQASGDDAYDRYLQPQLYWHSILKGRVSR